MFAQVAGTPAERPRKPLTVADAIEKTQTVAGSSFDAAALRRKVVEFFS